MQEQVTSHNEYLDENAIEKWPGKVMLVSCDNDPSVRFAIGLELEDSQITWHDTTRERIMFAQEIVTNDDNKFVFKRELADGKIAVYEIKPMSLSDYKKFKELYNFPDLKNPQEIYDLFSNLANQEY